MKKYDYLSLKAAQVTLRNAAERKGSWWRMFARYAEIANRKLRWMEIGLFFCLILFIGGCNTARETLNLGKAIGEDGAWILDKMSKNIQTEQE